MKPFTNSDVEKVFTEYPKRLRSRLLELRQLILDTASELDGVGPVEETLKWGQPSYLTSKTKSGTTIRIDQIRSNPSQYGMFVHCQTTLLSTYRELYSDILKLDGDRGVILDLNEELPREAIRQCIDLALTYHRSKRRNA